MHEYLSCLHSLLSLWTKQTRWWFHINILELIFIINLIGAIILRKRLMEGGKLIMNLKAIINQNTSSFQMGRNSSLRLSSLLLSYMVEKFGATSSLNNHEEG